MTVAPEQGIAPADGFWPWVWRIANDIVDQQVPGSIVLLIVAACLTPYAVQLARYWLKRRTE